MRIRAKIQGVSRKDIDTLRPLRTAFFERKLIVGGALHAAAVATIELSVKNV
jgi:hypothetical protein